MRLRVRVFGSLAEVVGARRTEVDVPDRATACDVLRAVGRAHPEAAEVLASVSVAVNLEVVEPSTRIGADDEVALLPPTAGGAPITVGLREEVSVEEAMRVVASPRAGGTALFVGTVRDHSEPGAVERLDYSAYEEMAEKVMAEIAGEAAEKWDLCAVAVLHAIGSLEIGVPTLVIATSAPHRAEALEACRYITDEVKARVPVWKLEHGPWGHRWV